MMIMSNYYLRKEDNNNKRNHMPSHQSNAKGRTYGSVLCERWH
jgi:hypothetical protein